MTKDVNLHSDQTLMMSWRLEKNISFSWDFVWMPDKNDLLIINTVMQQTLKKPQ